MLNFGDADARASPGASPGAAAPPSAPAPSQAPPTCMLYQLLQPLLQPLVRCLPPPAPPADELAGAQSQSQLPALYPPSPSSSSSRICPQDKMHLTTRVADYHDLEGFTSYRIITDAVIGGQAYTVSTHHRYSDFRALHMQLHLSLQLPRAFPVPRRLFHSSCVKERRVVDLQAYLAACSLRVMDDEPAGSSSGSIGRAQSAVLALCRFLKLPQNDTLHYLGLKSL